MMRSLKMEFKIIIGVIIFTILLGGIERYELSQNIIIQFIKSKENRNQLLADTIAPIIAIDLSLGLSGSYEEYLNQIKEQNKDIKSIVLLDTRGKILYSDPKTDHYKYNKTATCSMTHSQAQIIDPVLQESIASLNLNFDNNDYNLIRSKNRLVTLKIFVVLVILVSIFVFIIRNEFKELRKLTKNVLNYDPKVNNFPLAKSRRLDEIGIIHNAIITMVKKINSYSKMLDETNTLLEKKVKQRTKDLEDANKRLEALSTIDPLTHIYNRRYLDSYLFDIWNLSRRSKTPISIIMCDIDHFKHVNDTYGHQAGDEVLIRVARTLKRALKRNTDIVARFGGEEFIIVMYDTDIEGAQKLCENIAIELQENGSFHFENQEIEPFTLSFGVSTTIPMSHIHYSDLIHEADKALYKAKADGRNRIVTNPL